MHILVVMLNVKENIEMTEEDLDHNNILFEMNASSLAPLKLSGKTFKHF